MTIIPIAYQVSSKVVKETKEYLRLSSRIQTELVILWSGVVKDGFAYVRSAWLPKQYASPGFFAIPGDELFELNKTIYEIGEQIVAQVHTHPTLAFHSETDSEFAITAMEGGLSIVIPDFGDESLESLSKCAYFRFMSGHWNKLSQSEVKRLVRFDKGT